MRVSRIPQRRSFKPFASMAEARPKRATQPGGSQTADPPGQVHFMDVLPARRTQDLRRR